MHFLNDTQSLKAWHFDTKKGTAHQNDIFNIPKIQQGRNEILG
jgi:hypothetical protein